MTNNPDNTPNEEEWWKEYVREYCHEPIVFVEDIPAIISESEKRGAVKAVDGCKEIVKDELAKAEKLNGKWYYGFANAVERINTKLSTYKESLMKE